MPHIVIFVAFIFSPILNVAYAAGSKTAAVVKEFAEWDTLHIFLLFIIIMTLIITAGSVIIKSGGIGALWNKCIHRQRDEYERRRGGELWEEKFNNLLEKLTAHEKHNEEDFDNVKRQMEKGFEETKASINRIHERIDIILQRK